MSGEAFDPNLPGRLLDVIRPLQRRLNAERTLSTGKLGILHHLTEATRATAGELSKRLHVSPQAISLSTRELEELGLVVRTRDDEDRRRIWFTLTDVGGARYEEENRAAQAWLTAAIERNLSQAEVLVLAAAVPALDKLVDEAVDG